MWQSYVISGILNTDTLYNPKYIVIGLMHKFSEWWAKHFYPFSKFTRSHSHDIQSSFKQTLQPCVQRDYNHSQVQEEPVDKVHFPPTPDTHLFTHSSKPSSLYGELVTF